MPTDVTRTSVLSPLPRVGGELIRDSGVKVPVSDFVDLGPPISFGCLRPARCGVRGSGLSMTATAAIQLAGQTALPGPGLANELTFGWR